MQDYRAPTAETGGRGTPKYEQIRKDLASAIRAGNYRPGEALPSQRELSASYGVTLMTLRQALRLLSDEGLVVQQPGRGTFVTPPKLAYQRETLRSMSDELRSQGIDVETKVVRLGNRQPPASVCAVLAISRRQRALRIERLRIVDGKPAVHQVSWVPEPFAESIRQMDFTEMTLYAALAEHAGVAVSRGSETIRPALVTCEAARYLRITQGSPVFVRERVTLGIDDSPIVFDRASITGDPMVIRTERVSNTVQWSWGVSSKGLDVGGAVPASRRDP
ncbi:GntR family transcriptional regulator [Pseudonocardia nigra]|uniref:GntR family transcriptional regulator n=1 Tax=Pseudonocardia nigra TaxID=1921578 RepID=UPI0027E38E43|nr:GntR family transcriptional regulator [Pseudonocardia nigra]